MYRTYRWVMIVRAWMIPLCLAAQLLAVILIGITIVAPRPINWYSLILECAVFAGAPLVSAILWFRPDLVFRQCLRTHVSRLHPDVYPDYDHYMSVLASPKKKINLVNTSSQQPLKR